MRRAIHGLGLAPQHILVSTSRRTLQTMQAMEPWDMPPVVEPQDELYLADAGTILSAIEAAPAHVERLMVIGHNPGLHQLAFRLAGSPGPGTDHPEARRLADAYPSGALAEFALPNGWSGEGARLVRFICPRDLPEMTGSETPGGV